jgi:hypothetical protein
VLHATDVSDVPSTAARPDFADRGADSVRNADRHRNHESRYANGIMPHTA